MQEHLQGVQVYDEQVRQADAGGGRVLRGQVGVPAGLWGGVRDGVQASGVGAFVWDGQGVRGGQDEAAH